MTKKKEKQFEFPSGVTIEKVAVFFCRFPSVSRAFFRGVSSPYERNTGLDAIKHLRELGFSGEDVDIKKLSDVALEDSSCVSRFLRQVWGENPWPVFSLSLPDFVSEFMRRRDEREKAKIECLFGDEIIKVRGIIAVLSISVAASLALSAYAMWGN